MTRQRGFEFGLVGAIHSEKVNTWRKLRENKSYFGKVCADSSWGYLSISSDKGHFPPPGTGDRRENTFMKEVYLLLLDRWGMAKGFFYICCFIIAFGSK